MRIIMHVDMDAFFTSVEQHDNPSIKGMPVIVGSDPENGKGRGVVSAASYEARKYGIRSAMPISKAYKLCPNGVYLRPRMRRYHEVSENIMKILQEFTPLVEQISVDEAFIDCTGSQAMFGSPEQIAVKIKRKIFYETGLTASIGVSTNKSVSKIASDLNKPDGLSICNPGDEKKFISELPVGVIWGIGKSSRELLKNMGITVVKEIASMDAKDLKKIFGKNGSNLWRLANGIDTRNVDISFDYRKSISREVTFGNDIDDMKHLEKVLFEICDDVTHRLRKSDMVAKTVFLKLRLSNFTTFSRSFSFNFYTDSNSLIHHESLRMLQGLMNEFSVKGHKIRLIGAGISNLQVNEVFEESQLDLFSNMSAEKIYSRSDRVYDRLKEQYGKKVKKASMLE